MKNSMKMISVDLSCVDLQSSSTKFEVLGFHDSGFTLWSNKVIIGARIA